VIPRPCDVWVLPTGGRSPRVFVFDELPSTNSTATELARTEAVPFAVLARFQTAGRGQYGRAWLAPPDSSLLLSWAVRLPAELARPVALTALTTVAVAETVYSLTGIPTMIKWPNDILLRGKKVCGTLIEQTTATIIGIGLNLNQTPDDFSHAGLDAATSLRVLTGRVFEVRNVAECLLGKLIDELDRLHAGDTVSLEASWKSRFGLLGQPVVIECHDGSRVVGRLRNLAFECVELDTQHGTLRVIPESIRQIRSVAGPLPPSGP